MFDIRAPTVVDICGRNLFFEQASADNLVEFWFVLGSDKGPEGLNVFVGKKAVFLKLQKKYLMQCRYAPFLFIYRQSPIFSLVN